MSDFDSSYLLGIGDFSRFTLLSIRMLRHYDERGLLTPAYIDEFNGYRYYAPQQLRTASQIRELRDAGCGISQITELLPLFDDFNAIQLALTEHVHHLDAAAQKIADQRSLVTNIINRLKESKMSVTVAERIIPAMRVLSLRRTIANYHAEGELWLEFSQKIQAQNLDWSADFGTIWGATFYDDDYREADVDISVWAQYKREAAPADFTIEQLGERKVAWATMYGSYEQTAAVCEAIGEWISQHGYKPAGPMFNIYIVGPSQDPNPENWVTEINYPIV
ncbi:MAG: MerR family transcriptional regulator [Propionibacteriaceae bacterium]|nr:MerR family transcriptional regulator [Propionibacteriaceae bacterium]